MILSIWNCCHEIVKQIIRTKHSIYVQLPIAQHKVYTNHIIIIKNSIPLTTRVMLLLLFILLSSLNVVAYLPTTTTTTMGWQLFQSYQPPQLLVHNNNNGINNRRTYSKCYGYTNFISLLYSTTPTSTTITSLLVSDEEGNSDLKLSNDISSVQQNHPQPQQQQQNVVEVEIVDTFLPYLHDMERVLKNHAHIRQLKNDETLYHDHYHQDNNADNNRLNNNNNYNIISNQNFQLQQQQQEQVYQDNEQNYTFYFWCNEQRRNKPTLLLYDIDGAEKCIQMIRHLQYNNHQNHNQNHNTIQKNNKKKQMYIPEYAYQMIMKVILQRGRLRWKRNDNSYSTTTSTSTTSSSSSSSSSTTTGSNIICAADQLEELLYEYEQQQSQSSLHVDTTNDTTTTTNHIITTTTTTTSIETYNLVLQAYAICATPRGERQYATRAKSLLQRMEDIYTNIIYNEKDNNDENTMITTTTTTTTTKKKFVLPVQSYLHVLHAFAWQQGNLQSPIGAADEALQLLHRVKQCTNNVQIHMQATIWVLEAYSKSLNGATQCHDLLQDVKVYNTTLTESGQAHIARQLFDAEVYSNAILAWSKAATEIIILDNSDIAIASVQPTDVNNDTIEQAAKNAHTLLLELVDHYMNGSFANGSEPPLIAFNGVISAYSRLGNIDQAEDVLWLMERTVRPKCKNLVPNAISYNSILHGIYRQSQQQQNNNDNMKYKNRNNNNNSGNNRQSNQNLALQKAMSIISYMEENSKEELQPPIQPNAFSYQTLMKCWLQSTNHDKIYIAEQAEMLLNKVEELWKQGDTSFEYTNRIYNMLLNSYAKTYSGKRFLSDKALDLLSRMKQSTHAQCQPDIISYTSTLDCIAQSSDPKAAILADELLQEVKIRYTSTNDIQLRPNLRTYTMTIQSLARNNGNIVRARELLTELVQLYEQSGYDPQLKPNTYPFNYVLNCAANTINKDQRLLAFQIATQTYQEMRQSKLIKPDSFSYAFWFKCCNNLLDPGPLRTKGIMYAFEECKRDGLVSNEVLTRLVQGSPKDVVTLILQPQQQLTQAAQLDSDTSSTVISNVNANGSPEYNDSHNGQIQQLSFRDRTNNGHNKAPSSSSSSSFRPIMMTPTTSTAKVNNKNTNNSQPPQYRQSPRNIIQYTIHDLPPSWSRNVRSNQI